MNNVAALAKEREANDVDEYALDSPDPQPAMENPKRQKLPPKVVPANKKSGVPKNVNELHKGAVAKLDALREVALAPHLPPLTWKSFPEGQDKSPETVEREAEADQVRLAETVEREAEADKGRIAADRAPIPENHFDASNPSAAFAYSAGTPINVSPDDVHIDLGVAASNPMVNWWNVFLNGKLGGGFLARSLFCMATTDATLQSSKKWNGPTSMTQKKVELAEMRQAFLDWTDDATIHEWVRAKLFHIVCTNPKTYGKLKVTRLF
jgi:hypothetical protein